MDEMFRAVLADPSDDAPRQILADALIERGDPRGELIALQLVRKRNRKSRRRERELIETHREEWLGALRPHVEYADESEFRRGFPVSCLLTAPDDLAWSKIIGLEAWATYEHIAFGGYRRQETRRRIVALARDPTMRSLRGLHHVDPRTYALLVAEGIHLEAVQLTKGHTQLEAMPGLVTLGSGMAKDVVGSELFSSIEHFVACDNFRPLETWRAVDEAGGHLDRFEMMQRPPLFLHQPESEHLCFRRGADGRLSVLTVTSWARKNAYDELEDFLQQLGTVVTELVVERPRFGAAVDNFTKREVDRLVAKMPALQRVDLPW